jgi:hypothetical protein
VAILPASMAGNEQASTPSGQSDSSSPESWPVVSRCHLTTDWKGRPAPDWKVFLLRSNQHQTGFGGLMAASGACLNQGSSRPSTVAAVGDPPRCKLERCQTLFPQSSSRGALAFGSLPIERDPIRLSRLAAAGSPALCPFPQLISHLQAGEIGPCPKCWTKRSRPAEKDHLASEGDQVIPTS